MDLHLYRNAQDRWHDLKPRARDRGAVLAVQALTLTELVEKLTPDAPSATAGQRVVLVRRAAAQTGVSSRYAFDALSDLQSAGVPNDDNLLPFLGRYRQQLKTAGLADPHDRCWMAASRVAEGVPWLERFERVILHAIYDLNEAEFELVRNVIEALPDGGTVELFNSTANVKPTQFAEWTWQRFIKDESLAERTFPDFCRPSSPNSELLERLFVFDSPKPPLGPNSALRVIQAPSRYREIEAIGSAISDLLSRGEAAGDIAVVVRHIETYGEMIEDVFSRYAIPHLFETGVPLLRVPFIKYWFALLDLVTNERSRHALARILSSAYFEPRLSPGIDAEQDLAGFGYIDRNYLSASDLARRKASPWTAELEHFESRLDRLESGTDTVAGYLAELKPPRGLTPRDRQAWRLLSEELASAGGLLGPVSFEEFRSVALEIAAVRTVDRLAMHVFAPGLSRVRVSGPASLGYRTYKWLFAPGIADGEFPGRSPANPVLPDELVESINAAIRPRRIPASRDRNRREPLYLFMMLDSATSRVTLTFPAATLEGEPMVPSIYVGEIARHFDADPVERLHPELPIREPGEYLRRVAAEWRRGTVDDRGAGELLGIELVQRVWLEQRGPARGDVGRGVVQTERAWHPSELNALADCPFVFLSRHRLGLRTEDPPDFEVPVKELGKLAHDVLREFYGSPVPPSEAAAMERMEAIVRRRLADADISGQGAFSVFDPSLWKIRRAQLVAALHQYVRFAVKDALDGFQTLTEYLGDPLPRAQLGTITLGGRPDHVAVRRIGGRIEAIRVDDFKYSAASSATGKLLKDSFQIPIYAFLALRALDAGETVRMDGRYLLLKSPSTPVVSHAIDPNVFAELESRIGLLVEKVREGRLHPEPADRQDCPTCDYRRLCRLYGG